MATFSVLQDIYFPMVLNILKKALDFRLELLKLKDSDRCFFRLCVQKGSFHILYYYVVSFGKKSL